ncbi:MAG: electron transfer flavoprotein subunit beta/FixA family protein [Alphaproteobacteria bacterium]|nr:electron transfer flavoprotein subunit beta/FixA family protein [Alphaproteobacteria bacterium]
MKILVPIKRVIDHTVKVRVKDDHSAVDTDNVRMTINPFDTHALEEAISLKETGKASEVIALTIGPEKAQEQLRTALAMGADRAILVKTDLPIDIGGIQSLDIAKTIYKVANDEHPNLILMGKQSIDNDANQTPQMLAALLDWPQSTFTSNLTLLEEGEEDLEVAREVDGGIETLRIKAPAVISVDLRLNTPRYVKLPDIMKAKKKPLEIMEPKQLGLSYDTHKRVVLLEVTPPTERSTGIKVPDVDTLINKLKNEAKVI